MHPKQVDRGQLGTESLVKIGIAEVSISYNFRTLQAC